MAAASGDPTLTRIAAMHLTHRSIRTPHGIIGSQLGETSVALARARLWIFRIALHPAGSDVSKFARNANDQLDQSKKAWDAFRTLPFSDADEQRDAGEVNTRLENLLTTGYAGFSGYRVRRRRQNQICCVSHVSSTIWRCHRQNRLA
jgi:hypothetical protein